MLAIGRGLMSLPKLMLIDEASLGLSPKLAKTVFEIVDRINDDGVTVIIVEQNVGVLRHADSALVMEKGAIVYSGSGDELRQGRRAAQDVSRRGFVVVRVLGASRDDGGACPSGSLPDGSLPAAGPLPSGALPTGHPAVVPPAGGTDHGLGDERGLRS